jgi:hypothetical protein
MTKKMAMGGLGMDDSDMRSSRMVDRGMERRMKRGREMEGGMGRYGRGAAGMNMPTTGKPMLGGELPPVQNMGPGNMPPGKMPGSPGAGLTQSAAQPPVNQNMLRSMQTAAQPPVSQSMLRSMAPNNTAPSMGPMKMRNGGMARKGKTMAKGGLVKGCGCVAKGVKKPRYT